MSRKFTLTTAAIACLTIGTNAQRFMGVATGNYLPTKSIYLNPALLTDSKLKWSIDLFSMNAGLDQDYGTINSKNIFKSLVNGDAFNANAVENFLVKGNKDIFSLNGGVDVSIFNFYASFKNKHHFALTNRVRAQFNMIDYNSSFFDALFSNAAGITNLDVQNMRINLNSWSELGLSYATKIWENDKNAVSIGLTAKYLGGIAYAGTNFTKLQGSYANDTVRADNIQLNASTSTDFNGDLGQGVLDRATSMFKKGGSSGFGGDIGITWDIKQPSSYTTYEMDGRTDNIDPSKTSYKVRFSAAITDLGSIKYKNTTNMSATGSNSILSTDSVAAHYDNITDFRNYLASRGLGTTFADGTGTQTISLPTSLVLGIDYNINNKFFVNGTFIKGFKTKTASVAPYSPTQLTITPRFENKLFTVGLPLTYSFLSNNFKAGLGLRVSGLYLGMDDALALVGNQAKGINFYMGAQIPILKRRLKDKDGDKVSNKYDKCNGQVGTWADRGCPPNDRDKDGIVDSLDKCPDLAGVASAFGCPDADGDGIADGEDLCPNEPGTLATNGCPDRDGDGIADKDDKCPDIAGSKELQGCLDSDGDGIADWEDACPDQKGPIANQGCPDTDNDGIPDNKDKCPTVPGTKNNQGCPEVRAEVKKRLAFAATAIQFETGKAIIKPASYKLLDEVVSILNEYGDYDMTIDGYTDNTGNVDRNLVLSQERADAVKAYFVGKNIAESRLTAMGHGIADPVADNKTAAGRAKNRRVEMDLKLRN